MQEEMVDIFKNQHQFSQGGSFHFDFVDCNSRDLKQLEEFQSHHQIAGVRFSQSVSMCNRSLVLYTA